MSGGHYDYEFGRVRDLSVDIRSDADVIDDDRIRDAMRFTADVLAIASDAAYHAEWLMSDDISGEAMLAGVNTAKDKFKALLQQHESTEQQAIDDTFPVTQNWINDEFRDLVNWSSQLGYFLDVPSCSIKWNTQREVAVINGVDVPHIKHRGQLRRLILALKGESDDE